MNKYKKGSFIIILILLIVFLPITILSIYFHIQYTKGENPKKEFYYKNKLYFYDKSGDLVGTYECNYKKCGYAKQNIDEANYKIKHFTNHAFYEDTMINDQYAFIADYKNNQENVILYDIKNNEIKAIYKSYKNYGVGIVNNYFIVETKEGTYGVIKLSSDGLDTVIPFSYQYLALPNDVDMKEKKLSKDVFIAKKDNKWYLIDENAAEFTSGLPTPIVSFNTNTIIAVSSNYNLNEYDGTINSFDTKGVTYSLFNYDGTIKMNGTFKYLNYVSKYLEVEDLNNNYYIINLDNLSIVSNLYSVEENSVFGTRINNETNQLEVIIDNNVKQTIVIS